MPTNQTNNQTHIYSVNSMQRILKVAPLLATLTLSACGTKLNLPEHGFASYTGSAPFRVRHQTEQNGDQYIEAQGNALASFEMLEMHVRSKAAELCAGEPESIKISKGSTYPLAKLPEIRAEGCINGTFCQRDVAMAPVVVGLARCKPKI